MFEDNSQLLNNHIRRLQKLKEKKAQFGINTPSEILLEIEDIEQEINKIQSNLKLSILFLAADPMTETRLRLGEEFREIQHSIKQAKLRDSIDLELPQLAVRPEDVSQALLDTNPTIVHFSGHGTREGALCFENRLGCMHIVEPQALSLLFDQFSHISCVVLNSCYSQIQADEIAKHIDFVIGMKKELSDRAAIAFSIGFYQGLGGGRSFEDAYKLGLAQIAMQGIPEHLTPVLIKRAK